MKKTYIAGLMLSALALTACSDETYSGDAPKDWDGTTSYYNSVDERAYTTYFKPIDGTVGDPMPFYDPNTKEFKILYLQEYPVNEATYHPIYGVKTTDGAYYTGMGEILPCGKTVNEIDAALATGSVVYDNGVYYLYYGGHTAQQVVLRATSKDFKTWIKDMEWELHAEDYGYSPKDFRDPHIFKAEDNKWHMVISTKPGAGGDPKFAEFVSDDLMSWTHVGQFNMVWNRMCECPDIFKMGDYWYLVYSDMSAEEWARKVKYFMGTSWEDLKSKFNDPGANWPERMREGTLDARAYYAGKTASNGTDRFMWGWCPTRPNGDNANVGNADQGREPKWSGALVCHKVAQNPDGTLYLTAVPAMAAKYNKPVEVKVMKEDADHILYNRLGYHNHISFTVKLANKDDQFGVSFGRGDGNDKFVTLGFNNLHWEADKKNIARMAYFVGDQWISWAEGNFYPQAADNTYNIDIYTDNSVVVVYVNGTGCYTARAYGIQKNCWSINKNGNDITVSDVKVSQY